MAEQKITLKVARKHYSLTIAPFVDVVSLGEGEDALPELIALYRKAKAENWTKDQLLREASKLSGIYVPSLYEVTYDEDGVISAITPKDGAPEKVTKLWSPTWTSLTTP